MFRLIGSLQIAVVLLVLIAGVLAWGTIYEVRFGTAAVQRFVYTAWWFQALLGFLALNLAVAALQRWPWQRRHLPFVLAHIGIILILIGGIIGGRYGIDGQLIVPEGESSSTLVMPRNVLVVHQPNPGIHQVVPTQFETQAWVHEPRATFPVTLGDRTVRLTVDRYYPDAATEEEIADGGTEENPAVRLLVEREGLQEEIWLIARDAERFVAGWPIGSLREDASHLLFLEPRSDEQFQLLVGRAPIDARSRGVVSIEIPGAGSSEIAVPEVFGQPVAIEGTPYRVAFKEYFPDFVIGEQGPTSRSEQPNNPAIAFTLAGPEGEDPYLLFALHPDFPAMHGVQHVIHAHARYAHPAAASLPPNAVAVVRAPSGDLAAVLTGPSGERQALERVEIGARYDQPWTGDTFQVAVYYQRAVITQRVVNRSDEVRAEALHVVARDGDGEAEAWVRLRDSVMLPVGREPIAVGYRPAERELPFSVKLVDFRKIDYPGTQMAAGFESDVELSDPPRGVTLSRTISMNNPLKYRGYSLFQSSYIAGQTETTVLSVRNDPGTGLVYAGFFIVVAGIVSMFALRRTVPQGGLSPQGTDPLGKVAVER